MLIAVQYKDSTGGLTHEVFDLHPYLNLTQVHGLEERYESGTKLLAKMVWVLSFLRIDLARVRAVLYSEYWEDSRNHPRGKLSEKHCSIWMEADVRYSSHAQMVSLVSDGIELLKGFCLISLRNKIKQVHEAEIASRRVQ